MKDYDAIITSHFCIRMLLTKTLFKEKISIIAAVTQVRLIFTAQYSVIFPKIAVSKAEHLFIYIFISICNNNNNNLIIIY